MNEADEEAQMVRLQEIVEEELEKGTIEDFGRTHLYYHFRALGHRDVVITQRCLFDAVKSQSSRCSPTAFSTYPSEEEASGSWAKLHVVNRRTRPGEEVRL